MGTSPFAIQGRKDWQKHRDVEMGMNRELGQIASVSVTGPQPARVLKVQYILHI